MTTLRDDLAAILSRGGIADTIVEADRIMHAANASAPDDRVAAARAMAERRAAGAPLAYVTGRAAFMGIELLAAEGALVPREETELLGRTALDTLRSSESATPRVIDMCCGSGNLACAIARHLPAVRVWACDLTNACIALTRRNAEYVNASDRVVAAQGDLFSALAGSGLEGSVDAVVCTPPYISQKKLATGSAHLLVHEPREAFDAGPYGLSIHQRVVKEALPFLRPGGVLLFEIGLGQDRQVRLLFDRTKAYEDIQSVTDAAGDVRVLSGRKRAT